MIYKYDLHIHSGLSPCASKEMTPFKIVAEAREKGLDIISLTDHNAIYNVKNVMIHAKKAGILVVPGIEVSSSEDIHILCYFETYKKLEEFYLQIDYLDKKNYPIIHGRQYIYDENDNVVGEEERHLYAQAKLSENGVYNLAKKYGGIAIPAHIDRKRTSMRFILGDIPSYYPTIEISRDSEIEEYPEYANKHNVLRSSDAHVLRLIGLMNGQIELETLDVASIIKKISEYKN